MDDLTLAEHFAIIDSMQEDAARGLDILLEVDASWQPTDYLPDMNAENWREQVEGYRAASQSISDEMLVVLVGDMVTEEALPNYSISFNYLSRDQKGDSPTPWAQWLRGWTAEENRHGDLLNAYLRLTGRVDIRAVELTVHNLIAQGFNPKTQPDPYNGLIYTSFQERATRISHLNVGKIVKTQGDANLGKICLRIAGDEARHETFYTRMMGRVFDLDPNGAMLAVRAMLRTMIVMPGKLMYDGHDPNVFDHFAVIAQRTGVYNASDYAEIIDHLVRTWNLAGRQVQGAAAKAQDYLCRQPERYARLAEEVVAQVGEHPPREFAWIHSRKA